MPYIPQQNRDRLDGTINVLIDKLEKIVPGQVFKTHANPLGDLNYVIFSIITHFFKKEPRYQTIAELTGVLENVKQEFYRIHAGPYEDEAKARNGDI